MTRAVRPIRFLLGALAFAAALWPGEARAEYDWLQFGGDPQHGSNNANEVTLSAANVVSLRKRFSVQLPAIAAGAPVILTDAATASGIRDLLFVATTSGDIMALDAQTGATLWQHRLATCPSVFGSTGCNTTSSPAIDPSRVFVYAYGMDGFVHRYAVADGTETTTGGWPELVTLKPGFEKVSSPLTLAKANGTTYLYAATGGYPGDQGDYQGHLTAIDLNTGAQHVFNTVCSDQTIHFGRGGSTGPTCATTQSAIWARAGVVFLPDVNKIYMATGNGHFAPSSHFWGDSVLALNPDGTGAGGGPLDSYTPATFQTLDNNDADLGISAPAVFPTGSNAAVPHLALQGGKDGVVRLLNLDNLSGHAGPGFVSGEVGQSLTNQGVISAVVIWTNPADGSRWAFAVAFQGLLALKLTTAPDGSPALNAVWQSSTGGGSPLIANGVLYQAASNSLRALDPTTGALLWQDTSIGPIKWQSPVVANGILYLADQNKALTAWASSGPVAFGWGSNTVGQVNSQLTTNPVPAPRVSSDGRADVTQVASASGASVTLHSDGSVWTWGNAGMLGDGSPVPRSTPDKVPGLPRIVQVATGFQHVLAVGADGSLWAWGDDSCGELGPAGGAGLLPVKVPLSGVVRATAGNGFSVALTSKGEVYSFGCNDQAQLGQGTAVTAPQVATPGRVSVPYGIVDVSAGGYHGIALRNDGSVWTWGRNAEGQLGIDTTGGAPSYVGVRVDRHVAGVTKVATGLLHTLAIDSSGAVWNWGTNVHGELGDGKDVNEGTPVKLSFQAPAALIDGGQQTSVAVLSDGTTWSWGSTIGFVSDPTQYSLHPVQLAGVIGPTQIAMDDATLLALMPWTVVPNLNYVDVNSAGSFLQSAGLTLGSVTPVLMLCNFYGEVIFSGPPFGALAPPASSVDIFYPDPIGCM